MADNTFHQDLYKIMDEYVHGIFKLSKRFPREELFVTSSQLRRSALSIILNYVEGYARFRHGVLKNFLEISYGSLKESKYLLDFSTQEGWLTAKEVEPLINSAERIGKMLWGILQKL